MKILAFALVIKVTAGVVLSYRDYFPPDFRSSFLLGREVYFWNGYHWAFYLHIASGPFTLVCGAVLLSDRFRRRFAAWHRRLGRIQIAIVLLLLAPSGMWMAAYAETGVVASLGFASLAAATAVCAALGWRLAVQRRFAEHRLWMSRCYLLLCSAVVLRLIGGITTVAGIHGDWTYSLAAWISWLAPLAAFEAVAFQRRRVQLSAGGVSERPLPSN